MYFFTHPLKPLIFKPCETSEMVIFITIANAFIHALYKLPLCKNSMVNFLTITQSFIHAVSEPMVIFVTITILPFTTTILYLFIHAVFMHFSVASLCFLDTTSTIYHSGLKQISNQSICIKHSAFVYSPLRLFA